MSAEYVSQRYTAIEKFNVWPQARLHTQWPGVSKAFPGVDYKSLHERDYISAIS